MKAKSYGLFMWGLLTMCTLLLYGFREMPAYPSRALPLLWGFFSWNYYAYAFDKRMWPPQFVELHGGSKGVPSWRAFWFWFAVLTYGALLAMIAWAG